MDNPDEPRFATTRVDPIRQIIHNTAGPRQCTATVKDGSRCKKNPCYGSNVCEVHGGATPLGKTEAKRKLLLLVEPALAALEKALACEDWPVVVRAATVLLDRAGFGPTSKLIVENEVVDFSELSEEQLVQRAQTLTAHFQEQARHAREARESNEQQTTPNVH